MSKAKHRSYRKVLHVSRQVVQQGELTLNTTTVLWCVPEETTSRTVKTKHIMISVYIKGCGWGIYGWTPRTPVSIRLKDPLKSKFFDDVDVNRAKSKAYSSALKKHCNSIPVCRGTVNGFDKGRGEGFIICRTTGQYLPVYACNLKGAKTGYPETACVYLENGQEVEYQIKDGFVVGVQGKFDEEKWASLDQDRLAFKRDENGNFINGLFGKLRLP